MRHPPAFAWLLVGVVAFAASVILHRQVVLSQPRLWIHLDEGVYRAAGTLARQHPADLYRVRMGEPGQEQLRFTYPPFAALLFAAASRLSFGIWQIALVVTDLILLPTIASASLRVSGLGAGGFGFLGDSGRSELGTSGRSEFGSSWRIRLAGGGFALLLAAIGLWLEPVYMTMFYGQINLILLALIIADLALPDSSMWKGTGIGLAAGIKLTPLIFIPYLLASRRIRAGVIALLTFAATVAIGFAVLPAASRDYWGGRFAVYRGTGQLVNQSVNGVVQRLLHGHPPAHAVWLALAVIVVIAGLATAVLASRRGLELLGVVLCGVTGLLVSPLSWTHHWVWVLPGLTLMAVGSRRSCLRRSNAARSGRDGSAGRSPGACDPVGGAADSGPVGVCSRNWIWRAAVAAVIVAVFVAWPIPQRVGRITEWLPAGFLRLAPYGQHRAYTWNGATLLLGNSYVIAGAAAIAGTAGYLWITRGRQRDLIAKSLAASSELPSPSS